MAAWNPGRSRQQDLPRGHFLLVVFFRITRQTQRGPHDILEPGIFQSTFRLGKKRELLVAKQFQLARAKSRILLLLLQLNS